MIMVRPAIRDPPIFKIANFLYTLNSKIHNWQLCRSVSLVAAPAVNLQCAKRKNTAMDMSGNS